MTMTMSAALGALAGLCLWVALDAALPAQPHLPTVLAALNRTTLPPPPAPAGATPAVPGWWTRLLSPALRALRRAGLPHPSTRQDLAVLDRDPTTHLAAQLTGGLAGLLAPAVVAALAGLGGAHLGWQAPAGLALLGAGIGALLPQVRLHAAATTRRGELRHALSALLDLVVIALAGGAGVEQALTDASHIGGGWAMRRLRAAIDAAALARVPPWHTLGQLGVDTGVPQLRELASAVQLAGGEGARMRATLTARAHTLRARQAAELKAAAKAANQRMILPLMLLGLCYMAFLLYPALEAVKTAL